MAVDPVPEDIRDAALADSLSERYLAYALSTIVHRALPDARDGLKPVHRRLLHAMRQLGLDPTSGFKKCARVVGDVIGKYHPHGDQSVYEALVRLAQDFAVRYPLVDGQGNFGNVDGDNAAAMRYTEARLTEVAKALLEGLDEDSVDLHPTYDGEESEPDVLPAAFPNLLANGSNGIAVGMATSIPPHNLDELADALLVLLDDPTASDDAVIAKVQGPDLPTGGLIVEPRAQIEDAYRTGRGSFRLRAKWQREELARGTYQIVITQIPYQVQKSKLVERIADLLEQKKLPLLADVRDESDEAIRLVLEPKSRTVEPEIVMEQLFKLTDLEVRVPLNMTVLDMGRIPKVMSLRQALVAFLDHRRDVLIRRSKFRLEKIERRIEILDGHLVVYLNLDEVIRIVREEDEPKPVLMKTFSLSEVQADAILNMRLRSLRRLEEMEIRTEHKKLSAEAKTIANLLKSPDAQTKALQAEVAVMQTKFGKATALGARRTLFADAPTTAVIPIEAHIEREPVTVICSDKGWIRAMKGRIDPNAEIKYKDGDRGRFVLAAETTDKLVLFATNGRFYTLGCDKLQGGRGHGEPVRLLIDLAEDQEIVMLMVHKPGRKLLVAASDGRGFIVPEDDVIAQTRNGKQVLNPGEGAEANIVTIVTGDHVAALGDNRKLLIFPLDQLPEMPKGRGVILQRYKDGGLADVRCFTLAQGLTWTDAAGRVQSLGDPQPWMDERARAGRLVPRGFPKANRFQPS